MKPGTLVRLEWAVPAPLAWPQALRLARHYRTVVTFPWVIAAYKAKLNSEVVPGYTGTAGQPNSRIECEAILLMGVACLSY